MGNIRAKITQALIKELVEQATHLHDKVIVNDTVTPGFQLHMHATGTCSFMFYYRTGRLAATASDWQVARDNC